MGSIKEDFYSALRSEFYERDFTESFLYRYLAREKDEGLAETPLAETPKRADPYVLLKRCFAEAEQGRMEEADCLRRVLRVLIKNPKLRLSKPLREELWAYASRLRGGGADGARRDKQRYEALLALLERGAPAVGLEPGTWRRLREEVLKSALEVDAKAFLYDAGHPGAAGGGRSVPPRKKDRLLDMLDSYCRENPLFLRQRTFFGLDGGPGQLLSQEEQRQVEALYAALNASTIKDRHGRNAGERVMLPIHIDPVSGAGLYIVGRRYFDAAPRNGDPRKRIRKNCCYACFYPSELHLDEESESITLSWLPDQEAFTDMYNFQDLKEALLWYGSMLRNTALSWFWEVNGPSHSSPPQEKLRPYFGGGGTPSEIPVDRADLERAREECGEPRTRSRQYAREEKRN